MTSATADTALDVLKTRLKATWMDGNYDYFSRFMASSAAQLLDPLTLSPGATLLDVACGSGQLALVAAERGLKVTGVDIATNPILAARGRAAAAGLDVRFDEGDAEAMPYPDANFDVVASLYGAMFAPRPERVAAELLRVCRPGGIVVDGQLDEGRIRRRDVQEHCPIPDAARHAVSLAVGRRECRARALRRTASRISD